MKNPQWIERKKKLSLIITEKSPSIVSQKNCYQIEDNLYYGNEDLAKNLSELVQYGISHIVNCTVEKKNYFPEHFSYFNVPIHDCVEENLIDWLYPVCSYVESVLQSGGRVLIHCKKGISRSPAFIAGYLIYKGLPFEVAHDKIKQNQDLCSINLGFSLALLEWERRRTENSPLN